MIDYFIDAGLSDTQPSLQRVCTIEGYTLHAPMYDPQAALVVMGLPRGVSPDSIPSASLGWTIVVPKEPSKFTCESVVRRLGVIQTRTIIVALPEAWAQAVEFARARSASQLVLCGVPGMNYEEAFSRVWTGRGKPAEAVNIVLNLQQLNDRTTFLLPESVRSSCSKGGRYATYPDAVLWPRKSSGFTNVLTACAQLPTVFASNGDISLFLERYWSGVEAQLPAGFLPHLYGEHGFGRQILIQLQVGDRGIHFFGYDLMPSKPAKGWASRAHTLSLRHLSGGKDILVEIGNLRREILDVLPMVASAAPTQSYGVFGIRNNNPIPIELFDDATYEVELLDEEKRNVVPLAATRLLNSRSAIADRIVELTAEDGRLTIRVSRLPKK